MNESEIMALIRQEIRTQIGNLLMATNVSNENILRSTLQRFKTETPVSNVRRLLPYGFSSLPINGTECLVIPVHGNTTNLTVANDFDNARLPVTDGESMMYAISGQVVFLKNDGTIHQGTKAAASPVVLGDILKTLMDSVLNEIINSTQIGIDSFGLPVYLDPTVKANLITYRDQYVDTASTNFLGQKNFVERGV